MIVVLQVCRNQSESSIKNKTASVPSVSIRFLFFFEYSNIFPNKIFKLLNSDCSEKNILCKFLLGGLIISILKDDNVHSNIVD